MPPKAAPQEEAPQSSALDDMIESSVAGATAEPVVSTDLAAVEDEEHGTAKVYISQPAFDADEVAMPRLRLAQGLTAEVQDGSARPGEWVATGSESLPGVTIIPLMFARSRELRDQSDNTQVLCSSPDGVQGYGTPGLKCSECPLAKWGKDPKTDKGTPPPCSLVYSYVVYSVEHQQPFSVDFKRSGTNAAKFLNTLIQTRGLGQFAVKLGSSAQRGTKGTYYTPVVTAARVEQDVMVQAREAMGG